MKTVINTYILLPLICIFMLVQSSCTDDFKKINSNPETILEVSPERLLYNVQTSTRCSSWEWYYDYYFSQMRWMQYGCDRTGNASTTFTYGNNNVFAQRYSECFLNTGSYMKHMEYLVTQQSESERAQYSNAVEAARVTLIYEGIFASDTHGSLAYTEGWSFRSGGNISNPKFDTQEELYVIWDRELKESIAKFKANTNQKSLAGFDMAYNGDISKWIKAANALRLRIALRYMKRDITKAKAIAAEVLSTPSDIPSSNDDSFIFWLEGKYSENGDYYAVNDLIRASSSFMDYLNKYDDPRRRMFFRQNELSTENLAEWNAANPAKPIKDYGRWVGGTASFDKVKDTNETAKYTQNTLDPSGRAIDMQPVNKPQTRIFAGHYDKGAGGTWFPNLTYADFCFMAAEFVLEGVAASGKTAEQWYTAGVEASLRQWNYVGDYCKIHDYAAMDESEITAFMNKKGIKWDASIGKQQIYAQTYVEDFKNSNESWALYKRTGYPNTTSPIITFEECKTNGTLQQIPRRIRFSYPLQGTDNYANQVKRLDQMAQDPDFGAVNDEFGRIWWDKK